jgi:hypothetical protein
MEIWICHDSTGVNLISTKLEIAEAAAALFDDHESREGRPA